ncbi:30S ribosomal protein S11, chloroplastic-like [Gossypium raimondii]|uniref:30S ribosomal protein S11, chloroplastic-like n=1 Tax=Gossypium raimondii TaxID=29730 RepID=UPI00227CDAB5|nr:30S ribosomal protein S11, chloroplastic-like [Gossypium raimondii]
MAKPIPKVGSRRNGRSSARKSARRIPKGVIHVQASFNNTIVTVTDVRGRVISWSSAGTCGFKGTRRGPFCCSNRSGKCYSSSSRPRYATSRSYDKGSWSRKRCSITSYS